ncbi:unnamed protein product [Rotaria sp. Silwood1]|nr:unnamed protein product [Rotaria sp. Silwood1]
MNNVSIQLGNLTWSDRSFLPRAVDISQDLFVVVLGFVGDPSSNYTPCAYLLSRSGSNFTVHDTWMYMPPTATSWQASLTNWDADIYLAKHDMSVSINDAKSQVLLGIQITNTIILLDISRTTLKFILPSQSLSNGKAIGMGKAVGWLNNNVTVILVNTYSLSYIWSASQVFTYYVGVNNSFATKSIIPNAQQTLAPEFGPILISLVVTKSGIVIMLDSKGDTYILLPSPPGTFADSSTKLVSSFLPCIGGSYNSQYDIQPCSLCPQGSSTNGSTGQTSCVSCESDAFCPLGSAFGNISSSSLLLTSVNQARAYPLSPKSVRFDNILMENMFVISASSSHRCVALSPFFWSLIIMALGIVIVFVMIVLKYCVPHPQGKKTHQQIKRFFVHIDLVGEGELWIGGIVSFAILFLCISAYVFSGAYYRRYPIENSSGNLAFGCHPTLTNAQFSSGLMSLMIPPNDDELPIFELLDTQSFTLNIDFVNTLFACTDVSVTQIKDKKLPMPISSCTESNGSLSLSVLLPSHGIHLQFLLVGINTIGGIRLALQGPGTA